MKLIKLSDLPETGVSHNERIRKRTLLAKGEVGALINYARAVFPPGEKADAHCHSDLVEVFTTTSGIGEIRIDDVGYVLTAGTTVVVEPWEVHEITNTGSTDLILTYFSILL